MSKIQMISRDDYDRYFKLTACAEQLVDYFYETWGENIFIDYYAFCNYFIDRDDYEFTKCIDDVKIPWKWEIKCDNIALTEDGVYNLVKNFDHNNTRERMAPEDGHLFTPEEINKLQAVLKVFVNTNPIFIDDKNGMIDRFRKVKLPYCEIEVSPQEIIDLRAILKKDLKEQLKNESKQ